MLIFYASVISAVGPTAKEIIAKEMNNIKTEQMHLSRVRENASMALF